MCMLTPHLQTVIQWEDVRRKNYVVDFLNVKGQLQELATQMHLDHKLYNWQKKNKHQSMVPNVSDSQECNKIIVNLLLKKIT